MFSEEVIIEKIIKIISGYLYISGILCNFLKVDKQLLIHFVILI